MKRGLLVGVLGILCVGVTDVSGQPPLKASWVANYEQAKAAAKKSGKPMMVVFRCER